MVTIMDQEGSSGPGALDSASPLERVTSNPPIRRSRLRGWLALGLPLVALIGLMAAALPQIAGWATSEQQTGALVHTVTRGPLVLTVTENGNVESASNVDIKCRVQGGSTILWIVEDGKQVQKGEKIVELDPSLISDLLNAQKILSQRALATKIQAEKEYEAARIAVEEYRNGLFVKELQISETLKWITQRNLSSAEDILQHTKVMYRKGFVSVLKLKIDMAAVEQAKLELAAAKTGKDVLVNLTKAKMIAQFESLRDSAEARTASERAALKLEQDRLDYLEKQLGNCVIYAPQSGMVIYANEKSRRAPQIQVDEGVAVLAQQTIIRIPDLSHM